jgi:hypothetical protein
MNIENLFVKYAEAHHHRVGLFGTEEEHLEFERIEKESMQEIIQELEASIGKQYGGCTNCYGKGYCTNIDKLSGSDEWTGQRYEESTDYYLPCLCNRGEQIKEMQASIRREVVKDIMNLIPNTYHEIAGNKILAKIDEYALSNGIDIN